MFRASCVCAKLLQSCPTLCNPMDCSPPGSLVHGILQAKNTGVGCCALLQGVFPDPGVEHVSLMSPALAGGFFTTSASWEAPCRVSLCTIAERWKQPKGPSTDKWINKMWSVHTMGYYLALSIYEILIHSTVWMNVDDIVKWNKSQKDKHYMNSLIWGPRVVKLIETDSWTVGTVVRGEVGTYCLMGAEAQVAKMKDSGDGWWWWFHNSTNALGAVELYTLKRLKW